MTLRLSTLLSVTLGVALASTPAFAGPHGPGRGHGPGPGFRRPGFGPHGRPGFVHRGPRVFVGGTFFVDPFFWPTYPYYAPYPAYGYPVAPPPDDDADWAGGPTPDADAPEASASEPDRDAKEEKPEEAERANYGLLQLRGVPDGAAVDLDGRFWLKALHLDQRWLAVPHGTHTVTVYVTAEEPVERRVDVAAGKNQVVKFGPFPKTDS